MSSHHQTLKRSDYISDESYALEQERIFHRGWVFVGRSDRFIVFYRSAGLDYR